MNLMDDGQPGYIFYKGLLIGGVSYIVMYLMFKVNKEVALQRAMFIGLLAALYLVIFGPKIFGEINPTLQF
jgi:hypothetical protein